MSALIIAVFICGAFAVPAAVELAAEWLERRKR